MSDMPKHWNGWIRISYMNEIKKLDKTVYGIKRRTAIHNDARRIMLPVYEAAREAFKNGVDALDETAKSASQTD